MRLRIRYRRHGKIRFTSHRDTARIIERALRKIRLPVAYTEGFSPRPKLSFGLALTVAHESDAEFLDVELTTSVDLEDLPTRLSEALPDGLTVDAVAPLEGKVASLQQAIVCCGWQIEVLGLPPDDVVAAVAAVMAAPECFAERTRKGRTTVVDVRPSILELDVDGPTDNGVQLTAVLTTGDRTLRPSELIRLLHPDLSEGRVRRTHQWTNADGVRLEPLEPASAVDEPARLVPPTEPSARPAERQAS